MLPRSVLVVIPCLNEEDHIERVVTNLAAEKNSVNLRIVVADGGSTDQTRTIVKRLAESNPRIALMHNSKRIQAAAVNAAVRKYGGGAWFLIRVDAHADYPAPHLLTNELRLRLQGCIWTYICKCGAV
jgi:glycosyltransferase involved in cell wall biosynthesis